MQPFEFYVFTQNLLYTDQTAAARRSAISRGDYAAFLHAVEFLERMNVHLVTSNQHILPGAVGRERTKRSRALMSSSPILHAKGSQATGMAGILPTLAASERGVTEAGREVAEG